MKPAFTCTSQSSSCNYSGYCSRSAHRRTVCILWRGEHIKLAKKHTRTGVRRAGDDYQDLVALDLLVEFLEHPERYQWVRVEADDAGFLDDVVALKSDGSIIAKQVKYSTNPELPEDQWNWDDLLRTREGKRGELPSYLQKWARSLDELREKWPIAEASLVTNRKLSQDILVAFDTILNRVHFDKIPSETRERVIQQIGSAEQATHFFAEFQFKVDEKGYEVLEESLKRRFNKLGGTDDGWLNLKEELRSWVRNKDKPSSDGKIRYIDVTRAAKWYSLESMPQNFEVPADYVLPSKDFHTNFLNALFQKREGCVVLQGTPGAGKSTFLSRMCEKLSKKKIPIIRHHYYLSERDRTPGRYNHLRVAESLIADINRLFPAAVQEMGGYNPTPSYLGKYLDACAKYFYGHGKALIIVIDGLDHVWRERGSVEEMERLFEHLLPTPNGIVLVVGTQPLDASKLPPRLLQYAPREKWMTIPLLNKKAVEHWITKHAKEMELSDDPAWRKQQLSRIAEALYNKSQGHPLHLRYSYRALVENGRAISAENIAELPNCPDNDIRRYYDKLWQSILEKSRAVIHLLAACRLTWPKQGIVDCLEMLQSNIADTMDALNRTTHLLRKGPLGYEPFHSSLLSYAESLEDHCTYAEKMKKCALQWLQSLPQNDYLRWAHEWLFSADLGDETGIINGPNREWAIDAIARRRSYLDTMAILERSIRAAMDKGDLARSIEVGMLRDYYDLAHNYAGNAFDQLLYPQLLLNNMEFRIRVSENISKCSDIEILLAIEDVYKYSDDLVAESYAKEMYKRLFESDSNVFYGGDHSLFNAFVKSTGFCRNFDLKRLIQFFRSNSKNQPSARSLEILSESARNAKHIMFMHRLLDIQLEQAEILGTVKHFILLSIEEDLDLRHNSLMSLCPSSPFVCIYAILKGIDGFAPRAIDPPSAHLLGLKEHEHHQYQDELKDFFDVTFFSLLSNHLCGESKHNEQWLTENHAGTWAWDFVETLNCIASDLAKHLLSRSMPSLGWFYEGLQQLDVPEWREDRDGFEYYRSAALALSRIVMDVLILGKLVGVKNEITKNDLLVAFDSKYCFGMQWVEVYVARRRALLTDEAVKWVFVNMDTTAKGETKPFSERASEYSTLASIAALHNLRSDVERYIKKAASNLLSYGDHKDSRLYFIMKTLQACHMANVPECRKLLLQLVAPILNVETFTDGSDMGDLPSKFADVVYDLAPDLLPLYYEWLNDQERYYDAQGAFHVFVQKADLSKHVNQALARTAIDDYSINILSERVKKGDDDAKAALKSILRLVGRVSGKKESEDDVSTEGIFRLPEVTSEKPLPDPAKFSPDQASDYIAAVKSLNSHMDVIKQWLEHWMKTDRGTEAYQKIKELTEKGVEFSDYYAIYECARSLFGSAEAYQWLVKSHDEHYGWSPNYTAKENAVRIWEEIKQHYPNQWYDFIKRTTGSRWHTLENGYVRLVDYLILMSKIEMAGTIVQRLVSFVSELVSEATLETPQWARVQ